MKKLIATSTVLAMLTIAAVAFAHPAHFGPTSISRDANILTSTQAISLEAQAEVNAVQAAITKESGVVALLVFDDIIGGNRATTMSSCVGSSNFTANSKIGGSDDTTTMVLCS